ncbi:hypothetical protein EJB05_00110, partial [Eragrostis curvula]
MEAAVVSAAHGAMGSLLRKLGDLLTDKYKLLKGAKGQIMFLKAELEHMHVFLTKISDTEEPDEQDKCWAKEVRELSYDIEDSINEFMHRVECESSSKPRGFKGFINRSMNLMTTMNTRHEVAKELEGLKRRVIEVSERRLRYKVEDAVSKQHNTTIDTRLLALYAEAAGLVGINRPRDKLIQLLDEKSVPVPQLKVLSIVGFGGLGKTTLANKIYGKIKGQFQCQAFVSVSQKPNIRKILRTILSQVVPASSRQHNNLEAWDENELISALRKFLFDKRYLIVIDDIWSDSAWYIIKCALPENNKGSRVITTTRVETVATACCTNHPEYIYKMKPLCDRDSRRLFFKRIFGSEIACPLYLKDVSTEILKKCGGMPLAIITISSILASNPNRQKEQWDFVRKSLGSNLKVSSSLEHMRQILNLSYLNLPHYLKTCFLYLGIYPEDCTILRNDLTRQWMAEGFISKVQGADPKDVAKSYFNELINMSMVQPVYTDYNGEVMSCRVHDMMLDLILHKSREDNFITVIDHEVDMITQQGKIRRLSLHMDLATNDRIVRSNQLAQIRTFARFGSTSYLPPFQLFKHLRVLVIRTTERSSSEVLDFTGICHLFLLNYLKISTNSAVRLPRKVGGLRQLEVFEIESQLASPENELPSDIVHLIQLQHLLVQFGTRLPAGIGNMKSLRTLRFFDLATTLDNIKGLGELTNLTDLHITLHITKDSILPDGIVERAREVMRTCLEKLCNLKCLYMDSSPSSGCSDLLSEVRASFCHLQRFSTSSVTYWFSKVPKWIGQLHYLHDLRLSVDEVLEEDVGLLAQLSSLTRLYLFIHGTPNDKIIFRGSGFPALKDLTVCCCRISCLTFESGALTKLERITLMLSAKGWDRHGAAPAGLEHLLGIKKIIVVIAGGGAKKSNIRAAESVLRNAIDMHPCHPIAEMSCHDFGELAFTDRLDDEQEDVAGIYPEDCTIFRDDLTRQWVAEGFISKVQGADPEVVEKSYFNELINMSMIQPADTDDYNGEGFCSITAGSIPADEMVERAREVMRTCLEKLCNLKCLEMTESHISGCLDVLSQVPKWIGQLHYLHDLMLNVEEVLEDDVRLLAQLILQLSGISCLTFESGAMAKLERIKLEFNAKGWDRYGAAPAGLEHLSGIKKISVFIAGLGAKKSNRSAAESVLRNAIDMHPCHPIAEVHCNDSWELRFTDDLEDEQEDMAGCSI